MLEIKIIINIMKKYLILKYILFGVQISVDIKVYLFPGDGIYSFFSQINLPVFEKIWLNKYVNGFCVSYCIILTNDI